MNKWVKGVYDSYKNTCEHELIVAVIQQAIHDMFLDVVSPKKLENLKLPARKSIRRQACEFLSSDYCKKLLSYTEIDIDTFILNIKPKTKLSIEELEKAKTIKKKKPLTHCPLFEHFRYRA